MIFIDGDFYDDDIDTLHGMVRIFAMTHIFGAHLVLEELLVYAKNKPDPLTIGVRQALFYPSQAVGASQGARFHRTLCLLSSRRATTDRAYNHPHKETLVMPSKAYPASVETLSMLVRGLRASLNTDEAIAAMRAAGFDKIDCIRFVREHGNITLGQAKDIVHLSPAWADRYDADEALHDTLEQAAEIAPTEERTAA